jgi:hypothetical protein
MMQPAQAQAPPATTKRHLTAVETKQAPVIDGDLSDPAWQTAPKAEGFIDLYQDKPVAEQTVVRILYDAKYIYVAFQCLDSQPDKIVGRETVRDSRYATSEGGGKPTDDAVELVLDPFQSHRYQDVSAFSLNPLGTRSARLGGGRGGKREWKGDWDGAVKRTADGWTAEMRIPWEILSYPSGKQTISMGLNFTRYQYRTQVSSLWSNTGPTDHFDLEGSWDGVKPPSGTFRPKLSVLPYLLPGVLPSRLGFRSGVDARYTITPELTAVGSLNPDFATVEGAVESIQFSHTERFVPERRPFFLEGSSDFDVQTNYNDIGAFFYPRRIPTFDTGYKVYGKLSPNDSLGVLSTVDIHRRTDTVARYRHQFSPTSQAGVFLLQKSAWDDNNTVAAFDQHTRWGKLGFESILSFTSGRDAGGSAKVASLTYEDKNNLTALQYDAVSPGFRNADGFFPITDSYGPVFIDAWYGEWRHGFLRSFQVVPVAFYSWHKDGRPFARGMKLQAYVETRSDWRFQIEPARQWYDDLNDEVYSVQVTRGITNRFQRIGVELVTGRQANRPYSFIGPVFNTRLFRKVDLSYGGAIQNLDGSARQHVVSMNYELSPSRAIGGRLVSENSATNWYLSFRNSGERGTEYYFILGDPNARKFTRQALLKVVMAL